MKGGGSGNAGRNNRNGGDKVFSKKKIQTMNKMFKAHLSTKKNDSDSESEASAQGWKKGISIVHQMYIGQQYRQDLGINSEEEINDINKGHLKSLQKKPETQKKRSSAVEKYTQYSVSVQNDKRFQRNSRLDRTTDDTLIYV